MVVILLLYFTNMCRGVQMQIVRRGFTVYCTHAQRYECCTKIVQEAAPLMTRMTICEGTACKNSGKGRALYDPHNQLCESRAEIAPEGGTHSVLHACPILRGSHTSSWGGAPVGYVWTMVWGAHTNSSGRPYSVWYAWPVDRIGSHTWWLIQSIMFCIQIFCSMPLTIAHEKRVRQYCQAQFCTNRTSYTARYSKSAFLWPPCLI